MPTKFEKQVDSAIKEYNKSVAAAEKTIADATAQGKTKVANKAQSLLNDLKSYAPILETLKNAKSAKATYTGEITQSFADTLNMDRANRAYGGSSGANPNFVYPRGASLPGLENNRADAEYVSTGRSGISNTGKKYVNGQEVTDSEWNNFLYGISGTGESGTGGAGGAGGAGGTGGTGGGVGAVGTGYLTGTGMGAGTSEEQAKSKSAYDLLFEQFNQYGLGGLVTPLRGLIMENVSPSEFTIRLRDTDAYKKRFAANQSRIQKGLTALSEAEYIGLEDQYQNIMRNYGLPASYYARGDMGRQEGFEKFIAGDVSAAELEDRIQVAQNRVINAAPEIAASLRAYYPDISNGDILAYALDPDKALTEIRRKVTAAEIGGAATMAGLQTGVSRAEELQRYGVTGETARQGFRTVVEVAPRGAQLSEFYKQTPFTQETVEKEVFGLTGATEAERQRKKLTQLEQATFSGQAGVAGGALARDRAGAF